MISRRDFLRYCSISAAAIGLSASDLLMLEEALANPGAPSVIWLQGSACTGCSVSFLNRVSSTAPQTAADVLINSINLVYHPNIMAAAGESAVEVINKTKKTKGYVLVVEGGIPTAFGGSACWAWSYQGMDVTFRSAVVDLAARAGKILAVGTCASWGGMAAAPPNPTGVKGVKAATGKTAINIAGCPPHPDWIVWTISQILLRKSIKLDSSGRPVTLFSKTVHSQCPRREREEAHTFGLNGLCLEELGCRGPETRGNCPHTQWNNGINWCVGANALCIGCTEPTFPGAAPFFKTELEEGESEEDDD